jgi:hypothetical protein
MTFEPLVSLWLIIVSVVTATVLFIMLELRKGQRFRLWRIAATLIMMAALTMILLRPKSYSEKSSRILLLTERYSKQQVDSLLSRNTHLTLMHLQNVQPYKHSKPLASYELSGRSAAIEFVVGEGLPANDLAEMDHKAFRFFQSGSPTGITELYVSSLNIVHRKNVISGTYNNTNGNTWLYLSGPNGKEDSLQLSEKGLHDFKLSFVPKQGGDFIYSLLMRDSTHTREEKLHIHVEKGRPLTILFLQHYPTFETQYLKTFLQRKNHSLILRYQVSKSNFRYEFINHDRVSFDQLTSALLDSLDLVIADSESLSRLSAAEKNSLGKSIESGLGLLNLSVSANDAGRLFPFRTHPSQKDTAIIHINKTPMNVKVPRFRVVEEPSVLPVLKSRSAVLSGYSFNGAGRIGFQLFQETYPLALSGDSLNYAALWSPLLEQVARSNRSHSKIKIITPWPWFVNDPIDIEVISSTEPISLTADSVTIPLTEDIDIDNVWYGRIWVGYSGWHTLQTNDGSTLNYFVPKTGEWKSLSLMNQMKANALVGHRDTPALKSVKTHQEIPPLIFYLMFVISAGILWLTPKL